MGQKESLLPNLKGREDRKKAVGEIARVLKPNGQVGLILVDSWHLGEYLDLLRQYGVNIQKSRNRRDISLLD